jgi:hypothetical protein
MFCEKHGIDLSTGGSCPGKHCGDLNCDCPVCKPERWNEYEPGHDMPGTVGIKAKAYQLKDGIAQAEQRAKAVAEQAAKAKDYQTAFDASAARLEAAQRAFVDARNAHQALTGQQGESVTGWKPL